MTLDRLHTLQLADANYLRDLMEGDAYLDMDDPPHDQYTDEEHPHTDIEDQLDEDEDEDEDEDDITPSASTSRLPTVEEITPREEARKRRRRRGIASPSALLLSDSTWEDRGKGKVGFHHAQDGDLDQSEDGNETNGVEDQVGGLGYMCRRLLDNLPTSWKTNLSTVPISVDFGLLPSLRGRARSVSPPQSSSTFTSSPPHAMPGLPSAFEERFRWKICSSGLLDVTPKAKIGGREYIEIIPEDAMINRPRSFSTTSSSSYITSLTHLSRTAPWDRLDVFLATLVFIGGMWRIVGWLWLEVVAGLTILGCTALGRLIGEERMEKGKRRREEREAKARKVDDVEKDESLQAMALGSLEAFITHSEALDEQIGMGLGLMEESTSLGSSNATSDLRERLDDLLKSLSNRISTVTASLLPLASETELAGLAEMYGIDEFRNLVKGMPSSVQEDDADRFADDDIETPLHERERNPFEASPIAVETATLANISSRKGYHSTTAYPSSPSDTEATRLRPSRSISHLPFLDLKSPTEDRLTPLPRRSPLPGQRASWQEGRITSPASPWDRDRPTGHNSNYGTPSRTSKVSRWPSTVSEERDDGVEMTALGFQAVSRPLFKGSRSSFSSADEASDIMPTSPPRPTHKLRELRLSQSGIAGFSAVVGVENILPPPVPRPEDRQRKRRSLQDAGYSYKMLSGQLNSVKDGGRPLSVNLDFPPETRDPQVSLTRATSLPGRRKNGHVPSQSVPNARHFAAAAAAAFFPPQRKPPALSRGNSFRSEKLSESLRRPSAPSRAASLDPLTAAGLKANFFAMHRKRRQAVCCLLALYFSRDTTVNSANSQESFDLVRQSGKHDEVEIARYWANVHVLLDDLQREMKVAKEDLQVVVEEARSNLGPAIRPWPHRSGAGRRNDDNNFAPQTTDKVLLDDHIAALLHHLSQAEQRIQAVRVQNTSSVLDDHLAERWELVRGDIGSVIGDWERGRLVIDRLRGRERVTMEEEQESDVGEDLPTFLEDWTEDNPPPDTDTDVSMAAIPILEDDASEYLLDSTSPAFLPPPGLEAVFEATTGVVRAVSAADGSKSTREERIKATRAAREQCAKMGPGHGGAENQAPPSGKVRSGEMVSELKNVIGELRRRKEAVLRGGAGRANML